MYTEQQIKNILTKVIDSSKKRDQQIRGYAKAEPETPDYYPGYKYCCELMNRIKVHAEIGGFPKKLFVEKSPNMTPEEYNYIEKNYKQTTLPVYLDLLSTVNRIFHDSNWNIDYEKDESNESLQEYVEKEIEIYGSLENFVKAILPHIKLTDANGIIVIKPVKIEGIENEVGEYVIDTSKKLEPIPFYYRSDQIVAEALEYAMVELEEKSMVTYGGGKPQAIGRIFEFYDDQNIWRIEQVGSFIEYTFTYTVFFSHKRGELPYHKLMGVPHIAKEGIIHVSPFTYVTDILDLVAINATTLDLVTKKCAFPFMVIYGNVCEFENVFPDGQRAICNDGKVFWNGETRNCSACEGTGVRTRVTPLRTMILKPSTSTSGGDDKFSQDPISYVAPDTTILNFLRSEITDGEKRARNILHLNTSTTQITSQNQTTQNGDSTATGMMLDLKALYAFIKPISDQIFTLYEFMMDWIRYDRYGEEYPKPSFSYPISFDFHTEQDYLNEISAAQNAGLPPSVTETIMTKYMESTFYNERHSANVFNLIKDSDRLLSLSNDDLLLKLSKGVVEKWEIILHDSAINFISELNEKNEKFFDQEFSKQKQDLIAIAKEKANSIKEATPTSSGALVNSILNPLVKVA